MAQDVLVVAESLQSNNIYGGVASASVSVATAVSTTIPLTGRVVKVSATAATTSGSCTLANGTLDGQEVYLVNESANSVIISGGMKAAAAATVAANVGKKFVWVAADTAWYPA